MKASQTLALSRTHANKFDTNWTNVQKKSLLVGNYSPPIWKIRAIVTLDCIFPKSRDENSKTGWWFQPIWKICSSNWTLSPRFGVKIKMFESTNQKNSWNRQVVIGGFLSCPILQHPGSPPIPHISTQKRLPNLAGKQLSSQEKKQPYFEWNTGRFIGILILVDYNPHITG